MSETFSSMCANSVAPAVVPSIMVSVDISILPIVAHHASESPVFLRHLLDDHVEVGGGGAGVLHHGVSDGANQRFLLRRRSSCPHLHGHNGHITAPPAILFRSARGRHPISWHRPSPAPGCLAPVPRSPSIQAAWPRRNRRRPAVLRGQRRGPISAAARARPRQPRG